MKSKESEKRQSVEVKQEWKTPRIFELDFSETQVKAPPGGDGDPPAYGNIKTGS